MLTATLLCLVVGQTAPTFPENAGFDYSGLPIVRAAGVRTVTHSVTLEVTEEYADVSSTTVYKNDTDAPVAGTVLVPRFRVGDARSGMPAFNITASWDRAGLPLLSGMPDTRSPGVASGQVVKYYSHLVGKTGFKAKETHALRINYRVMVGKCGFDQRQKVVGYVFDGGQPIGSMNISYRYGGKTVFRLPEAHPAELGWQVGEKGVFKKADNYTPDGMVTYLTFYPGGFKDIGH